MSYFNKFPQGRNLSHCTFPTTYFLNHVPQSSYDDGREAFIEVTLYKKLFQKY